MSRGVSRVRSNLGWVAILMGSAAVLLGYQLVFDTLWDSVWNIIGIASVLVATVMLVRSYTLSRRQSS
jgi:hypothetical protein